ncbi:HBS1-like protein isoform X1 [Dreissena polymorpha]|uniref:HBS1-like protein isoform X1 n=1 Tax=Dreissena polymorpha TaxID=45954 RepID=UPI002264ED00|nr:HBS1-like protein isoform X1 [Dreissena polymorpha]
MSRHRNVRALNYEDDYYDEDDVYGHSVEDNYCISPGTAEQFTFDRDRNVALANYMDEQEVIHEEEEPGEELTQHRVSHDPARPTLSEIDEARLNSCLDEVRSVLGDSVPEHVIVEVIVRHNFSIEGAFNELLNQQEAPKPQREPRDNRRNRSQGEKSSSASTTKVATKPDEFPVSKPAVILQSPKPKYPSDATKPQLQTSDPVDNVKVDLKSLNVSSQSSQKVADNKNSMLSSDIKPDDSQVPLTLKPDIEAISAKGGVNVAKPEKDCLTVDNVDSGVGERVDGNSLQATPKKERFIPPLPKSSSKSKYEKFDLKQEYKKRNSSKEMLNLVVIGHVDAGKSTLMGHLLFKLGKVNQRTMHKYEQESRKIGKSSFMYAWVLDETEEERARGVTMDIAQTQFETPSKVITLLDAPGHKDFIPNMITGTAQADVAILVVNATTGEFETGFESGGQTREHALLARSLGVQQLLVAVNKMDTVNWDPSRYDEVVKKLGQFLKQAGFKEGDTSYVPVSGLAGENLAGPVKEARLAEWYKGSTLAEQIDKFRPVVRPVDKPVRVILSDVFKGLGAGLTATGKVVSGAVQLGDRLSVMPAGEYTVVKGISINDEAVNFAFAGDHVQIVFTGVDITNVGVGSVLCDCQTPVVCASRILARVVLFNLEVPITRGFTVIFHYQTVTEPAILKKLVSQLNKSTGEVVKNRPKCLTKNSSAVVEIELEYPVCVELYKDNKELGRFMLRSSGHTIAAGLIEEVLKTKTKDGTE